MFPGSLPKVLNILRGHMSCNFHLAKVPCMYTLPPQIEILLPGQGLVGICRCPQVSVVILVRWQDDQHPQRKNPDGTVQPELIEASLGL